MHLQFFLVVEQGKGRIDLENMLRPLDVIYMMRGMKRWILSILVMLLTVAESAAAMPVHVSVPPQVYFVEKVGGDRVVVTSMVPAGESCETFQPRPSQITQLSRAQVFFSVGLPFEKAILARLARMNPEMKIVATAGNSAEACTDPAHDHPAGHAHNHDSLMGHHDPHLWLSPARAREQAAIIRETLSALDPDNAAEYAENFAAFVGETEALDAELATLLAPFRGRSVFVYHPAFGSFTDAYGLEQRAIEHNGAEPSPVRLSRLINEARATGVRTFFVQPAEAARAAGLLAQAVGGSTVILDPMRSDWADNMREIAEAVAMSFKGEAELETEAR